MGLKPLELEDFCCDPLNPVLMDPGPMTQSNESGFRRACLFSGAQSGDWTRVERVCWHPRSLRAAPVRTQFVTASVRKIGRDYRDPRRPLSSSWHGPSGGADR